MLVVTILPLMKAAYASNHFEPLCKVRVKVGHCSENVSLTKHSNFKHFQTMTPGDSVPERCLVLAALLMILLLLFTNVLRKVDPLEG